MSKGIGELLVKGAICGPAKYEIQSVVRGGVRSDSGWITGTIDVIEKCFGRNDVSLRLANGKLLAVQVGTHHVTDPDEVRAELFLNEPF